MQNPTLPGVNAPMIIGGLRTEDVLRRWERKARDGAYQIEEWLIPSPSGELRVGATITRDGEKHGYGFRWDGNDINTLVTRIMALDMVMRKLPGDMARGVTAPWRETAH